MWYQPPIPMSRQAGTDQHHVIDLELSVSQAATLVRWCGDNLHGEWSLEQLDEGIGRALRVAHLGELPCYRLWVATPEDLVLVQLTWR